MEERLKNILLQAKGGSRDIDELHKELCVLFSVSQQSELCEGKCGMSYCDDNGCIDRKRILVEPKDKPEHCG